MTVREYMRLPEAIREEILRKKSRILFLRRLCTRLASPPQQDRVRSSPDPSRMQGLLSEIADEERAILRLEETLMKTQAALALYISHLPDERMVRLLELRYLNGYGWDEIGDRMGFCMSWIYRLHKQALSLLPPPPEGADSVFG